MPVVHPYSGEGQAEYVDVDELCVLLTRRSLSVLKGIKRAAEEGKMVRIMWKPGADPVGPGLPCFHIEDMRAIFDLPQEFVDEIIRFRRQALSDEIVISLPERT